MFEFVLINTYDARLGVLRVFDRLVNTIRTCYDLLAFRMSATRQLFL